MGKPALVVLGAAAGAILILDSQHPTPPAAAPAPATRTVVVHQTVTRIVQVGHSGLPAWAVVIIVIVALGALCGLTLGRRSES
jgi:hypothetical protein